MKVTLAQAEGAQKEIVIHFDTMDSEVRAVLELLGQAGKRLCVRDGDALAMLDPADVLYFESVDAHLCLHGGRGIRRCAVAGGGGRGMRGAGLCALL